MTRSHVTSGMIVHTGRNGIEYRVCRIDFTEYEDGNFEYVFTPDYNMISLLPPGEFQGIPGLDLDLHLERYVRKNFDPVFISERTPGRNREDLVELLESVGMTYLNRLEWGIRSELRYNRDRFHIIRFEPVKGTVELSKTLSSSADYCRNALVGIGMGKEVTYDGVPVDASSLPIICNILRGAIDSDTAPRGQRGRRRIPTNWEEISEAAKRLENGEDAEAVSADLGISRATLYRRIYELKNENSLI